MNLEDSKSVPIWYHVPIRYHYKFDANIVFYFVKISQYPVENPTKAPTTKQITNMLGGRF